MSRVFRLGVVETLDAPYHYPCFIEPSNSTNCKIGISGEIWTLIAERMNWTLEFVKADGYGGYEPDESGYFSGVLGMIQNGSIDGTLNFQSLRTPRYSYFKYTEVAQEYESGLVIGENVATKSEIQVQVFEWSLIAMILGSLLVIFIYQQLILKYMAPDSNFFDNWTKINPTLLRFYRLQRSLPNGVLAMAFTLINIIYFAEFRSQVMFGRMATSNERDYDFFADRNSKVIVWSAISLTEEHRRSIFGPRATAKEMESRIIEMPNVESISEILCRNPNIAYYTELTGTAPSLSFKGTRAYIISKTFPSKQLEAINDIIRKIFNIDRSEYLLTKYGIFPRNVMPTGKQRFLQRISISYNQIDQGLYMGGGLLLLGCLLLCFEILYFKLYDNSEVDTTYSQKSTSTNWIMGFESNFGS